MKHLKRLTLGFLAAVAVAVLLHPAALAQTINCSGSFTPNFNCLITGTWNFAPTNGTTAYDVPFKTNGSEATGVVSKVVTLTNAQVLALNLTPITVIAAPGIGKYVDVISVNYVFDYVGAYTSPQDVRCYWGRARRGMRARRP